MGSGRFAHKIENLHVIVFLSSAGLCLVRRRRSLEKGRYFFKFVGIS